MAAEAPGGASSRAAAATPPAGPERIRAARLADGRIRLDPLAGADAGLYLRIYTDPTTMAGLGGALSPAAARRSFRIACTSGGAGAGVRRWWTIRHDGDADDPGDGLGLVGLEHDGRCGELGVVVARPHRGAGVARRALALLAGHAFGGLGLVRLRIRHRADNPAMAAVAARLGFERSAADAGDRARPEWLWTRAARATGALPPR